MASWQDLNALADGELSAEDSAALAETLAGDPDGLRDLAGLLRLKRRLRPRRRPLWRVWAVAPALVLGAALVTALPDAPVTPPAFEPVREHAAWATEAALPTRLDRLPAPPDLSAAGLFLVTLRSLETPAGPTVRHMGWHGTRGCRVSLFAETGGDPTSADVPPVAEGDGWRWRIGGTRYRLLASGMPADRLRLLAGTAYEQLLRQAAPDAATRDVLARSRAETSPCIG